MDEVHNAIIALFIGNRIISIRLELHRLDLYGPPCMQVPGFNLSNLVTIMDYNQIFGSHKEPWRENLNAADL